MKGMKRVLSLLLALMLTAAALPACKKENKEAEPTPTVEVPQVTPAPEKIYPPEADRFADYTLKIQPVRGPSVVMTEPVAAGLIMDAYSTQRLTVTDAAGKFGNKVDVLDEKGEVKLRLTVSSDGLLLMKAEDGRVFRMPQYVYYLLEQRLWGFEGSLKQDELHWTPPPGDDDPDTALLETDLGRLIKASMLPAFGYAMAYFDSYTLYGVDLQTKDTAKVFILLEYAGYDIQNGTVFGAVFQYTTPATLIFKRMGKDTWRLTGFKQPVRAKEGMSKADRRALIRKIFPYEYTDQVMKDMLDTSALNKDIVRQATDFLREQQLTGLTVGD